MNDCHSAQQNLVSIFTNFSGPSGSSASGKLVEINPTDGSIDNTSTSECEKTRNFEFITCDNEDSPSKSLGRKRCFGDITGEETLAGTESDVECRITKTRRFTDSIDSLTSCDSGFPVFPIDNCLKTVQTPYCIVFPSINVSSSCSESTIKDGERQILFSNIQNLSPAQNINELRPSLQITNTSTSATRFTIDELDVNSKYGYIDVANIENDEDSDESNEQVVAQFVPINAETFSQYEDLPSDDGTELKSSDDGTELKSTLPTSHDTDKHVVDIVNPFNVSNAISTVNSDTLVTITQENVPEQSETSTLSGRILGPQVIYTTHPRGQLMFAENLGLQSSSVLQPKYSLMTTSQNNLVFTPSMIVKPQLLSLNSSGEETSPENNSVTTPVTNLCSIRGGQDQRLVARCLISSPKHRPSSVESNFDEIHGRESHNIKERKRRARIKEACDLMRFLVPGMTDKTDKATVFEFGARYIHFLKSYVGTSNDKDFLIKYSPYY